MNGIEIDNCLFVGLNEGVHSDYNNPIILRNFN